MFSSRSLLPRPSRAGALTSRPWRAALRRCRRVVLATACVLLPATASVGLALGFGLLIGSLAALI